MVLKVTLNLRDILLQETEQAIQLNVGLSSSKVVLSGVDCLPGDMWQCVETTLVVTTGSCYRATAKPPTAKDSSPQ